MFQGWKIWPFGGWGGANDVGTLGRPSASASGHCDPSLPLPPAVPLSMVHAGRPGAGPLQRTASGNLIGAASAAAMADVLGSSPGRGGGDTLANMFSRASTPPSGTSPPLSPRAPGGGLAGLMMGLDLDGTEASASTPRNLARSSTYNTNTIKKRKALTPTPEQASAAWGSMTLFQDDDPVA